MLRKKTTTTKPSHRHGSDSLRFLSRENDFSRHPNLPPASETNTESIANQQLLGTILHKLTQVEEKVDQNNFYQRILNDRLNVLEYNIETLHQASQQNNQNIQRIAQHLKITLPKARPHHAYHPTFRSGSAGSSNLAYEYFDPNPQDKENDD